MLDKERIHDDKPGDRRRSHGDEHGHGGEHGHPSEHDRGPRDWADGKGRGHGRGHHEGLPFGEPRGRARRGEVRYVLLDALRDGPKHGYEIVKALEERSAGQYVPSPGTVYPTMQFLQDQGLVSVEQDGDRRVFQLTEAGRAELAAHAEDVLAFWARFAAEGMSETSRHEVGFLQEELESLTRTVWGGLRDAIERGDREKISSVRQAVEGCRNQVRGIISGSL